MVSGLLAKLVTNAFSEDLMVSIPKAHPAEPILSCNFEFCYLWWQCGDRRKVMPTS